MAPATDRQTFRETVALVAAKATAKLPQAVNGRIESAVKLVICHDVTPQEDGSILVGSSTDPLKTYRLVGTACECQDFTRGQAPEGWCQHRIAAGIAKRVHEQLAAQAPARAPEEFGGGVPQRAFIPDAPTALPEAPASANVRVQIAGREVQITLRDTDETKLLARLQTLLEQFPVAQPASLPQDRGKDWCPIHEVEMHWNEGKDGRKGWHSHRTAEGQWCQGRKGRA